MPPRAVHDISVPLGGHTQWPGDRPFRSELISSINRGDLADVTALSMTVHSGTHLDAPAHFISGGRKLSDYPASQFILPAIVVEVGGDRVTAGDLHGQTLPVGGAVLFKTRNSARRIAYSGQFDRDVVCMTVDAAKVCVQRQVALVGIDCLGVDDHHTDDFPVHFCLLGAGVLILETVDLSDVAPGPYTLVCLPLRLKGSEGSPVRAVLLEE